jgi:hypothetical protein
MAYGLKKNVSKKTAWTSNVINAKPGAEWKKCIALLQDAAR